MELIVYIESCTKNVVRKAAGSMDKHGNLDAYDQKKNPGDYHSPKEHDAMYKRSWYPSYTDEIKKLFATIRRINRYGGPTDENILI